MTKETSIENNSTSDIESQLVITKSVGQGTQIAT